MSESVGPVTVTSSVGEFEFRSMLGSEELGQPFRYDLELLHRSAKLAPEQMLGSTLTVHLTRRDGKVRHFNGYVTDFSLSGIAGELVVYSVTLRPWLYLLGHRTHCRIFKGTSVDIVKELCNADEYKGISALAEGLILKEKLPTYEFVVQFRESDLNFLSRVLERDGLYYYFEHQESLHTLVLTDSGGFDVPDYQQLSFRPPSRHSEEVQESVDDFRSHYSFTAGELTTKDFSYKAPAIDLRAKARVEPPQVIKHIEAFDYPGGYFEIEAGQDLATRRLETLQVGGARFEGTTNVRTISAGQVFTLAEHPFSAFNRQYLIYAAQFQIVSHAAVSSAGIAGGGDVMRASLLALDAARPFHPLPRAPKPAMTGVQTAIVVGEPSEQEIHLDPSDYCRVKVKFPWDRDPDTTGKNSCWVRVSQDWAGSDFGVQFHPRIGQEVLIGFIEGDPDRPIVVGRVYNDANRPPFTSTTQSGIRTNSTPDGGIQNYNEIRFEDKKGAEELFVQAEKTHTVNVKGSRSVSVGGTQSTSVTGNETRTYQADRKTDVFGGDTLYVEQLRMTNFSGGRDQTVSGGQDVLLVLGNDKQTEVGKSWVIKTATGYKLADNANTKLELAGGQVLISAPAEIKLQCGGTTVVLTPEGVTIDAKSIKLTGATTIEASGNGNTLKLDAAGASLTSSSEVVVVGPAGVKLNS